MGWDPTSVTSRTTTVPPPAVRIGRSLSGGGSVENPRKASQQRQQAERTLAVIDWIRRNAAGVLYGVVGVALSAWLVPGFAGEDRSWDKSALDAVAANQARDERYHQRAEEWFRHQEELLRGLTGGGVAPGPNGTVGGLDGLATGNG